MPALDDFPNIVFDRREDWRRWLAHNHGSHGPIWAVTWKKTSSGPYLAYGDLRDEALCWGWIDSLRRKVDDEKTALFMARRKPGSAWSAVNKARIEALVDAKLMQPSGLDAVTRAKADGAWL